jgi:hypothetical protein
MNIASQRGQKKAIVALTRRAGGDHAPSRSTQVALPARIALTRRPTACASSGEQF